ncbi:hypothetical protein AC244_30600 [Ensifer adhaerens]|uniref:Uncharacterized protein n=1 Tax=Ensifer adhaerens TaxID=106592 RepID=A0A0L8BG78_ENSAD|nr:DUF6258 family protein [Ensifer adhaerens]KOF13589.1 hypothetical protein AC244_30600 [Ensifer adhaerens]
MKPDEFLSSVYLGDRACKVIVLDGWKDEVRIQINLISRRRSETWDFYSAEDVEDGFLVFEGVDHVSFDPPGLVPNDAIGNIEFLGYDNDCFTVMIELSHGDEAGKYTTVRTTIRAKAVAIERPGEESARIRD